jgi:hypothetical protein
MALSPKYARRICEFIVAFVAALASSAMLEKTAAVVVKLGLIFILNG